jgi:hypothetical protein
MSLSDSGSFKDCLSLMMVDSLGLALVPELGVGLGLFLAATS